LFRRLGWLLLGCLLLLRWVVVWRWLSVLVTVGRLYACEVVVNFDAH
jgi:hypothetical protein